jgi:hypothetical protein
LRRIALAGLIAVATALGSAAAPATAAVTSVAVATPVARDLFSVSCLTAKNCLAVGQDLNAFNGAGGPLAETWNGTAWKLVAVRLPAGATGGGLGQVTCLTATNCRAVGFYTTGGRQYPLYDTWNGKTWTPGRLPGIGGTLTALEGISCLSAANCVAVGAYTTPGPNAMPLAGILSGVKWTQTRPPAPTGTTVAALLSVSCASATFCVGGGEYALQKSSGALIDLWNGRTWSLMTAAEPRGHSNDFLSGVSCRPSKTCFVVGSAFVGNGLVSLAEMWNGKQWVLTPVPWPKGTSNPGLSGVSCVAANRCVAVGNINQNVFASGNYGKVGAATWNGKAWTVTPTPTPAKNMASLFNGVTCLSATSCVAVGQIGKVGTTNGKTIGTGLSGFWNGTSWHLIAAK